MCVIVQPFLMNRQTKEDMSFCTKWTTDKFKLLKMLLKTLLIKKLVKEKNVWTASKE